MGLRAQGQWQGGGYRGQNEGLAMAGPPAPWAQHPLCVGPWQLPGVFLSRRITDMSKVSMSSRPEPGYENMDHFSINVDYVAEMLRTIEFQTGAGAWTSTAMLGGDMGLPRACSTRMGRALYCLMLCVGLHPLLHRSGDMGPLCTAKGPFLACGLLCPTPGPGSCSGLVTSLLECLQAAHTMGRGGLSQPVHLCCRAAG